MVEKEKSDEIKAEDDGNEEVSKIERMKICEKFTKPASIAGNLHKKRVPNALYQECDPPYASQVGNFVAGKIIDVHRVHGTQKIQTSLTTL
jgi:hypothetical protein